MNLAGSAQLSAKLKDAAPETRARLDRHRELILRLARLADIAADDAASPAGAATALVDEATVIVPLAGLIDLDKERARLAKEIDKLTGEVAKLDAAKKFVAFLASVPGCDAITKANGATGPYLIKGCKLPDDVPAGVADLLPYFQSNGTTAPALEFVSPVKGPNLSQITVEVNSGIRSPEEGAALYDEDVKKQAQQLGLPGW